MNSEVNGQFGKIIEQARNADALERPILLKKLAALASNEDLFTVAAIAKEVAHYDLSTATDFKKSVKQAASKGRRSKAPKPSENELARLWIEAHPHTAFGGGFWRRYSGGCWPMIDADRIKAEVMDILEASQEIGIRPTAGLMNGVTECARVFSLIDDLQWDANHDILVCKNGTLDISARTLREHRSEDHATSSVPFDYNPQATCPTFRYALNSTIPESADFLQEYAGYCLTTDMSYEIGLWLYGPRGSGKSTIIEGIAAAMGDQRCGILSLYDIERSRFALADLPGKTLVISTEQPNTFVSATHVLNQMISGEKITVEKKYKDAISFIPRAKLLWSMNELPRIADASDGIFRRVKAIKFPELPEDERDPNIKKDVRREGPGILNWALDGLMRLHERGHFDPPDEVNRSTQEFQDNNDIEANFRDECLSVDLKDHARSIQSSELYTAYNSWCYASGHKPKSSTKVAEDWIRLGFEKFIFEGRRYWRYVSIR